ncbi:MAG: hypothetical protein CVV13_07090 [Gammaproteobacteria bacterium HGW-Gammaproteobacteria-3]|jgi:hypothetical protein|nr:MAG: hypothetical protein CVV13_07090 [Gammaproteobacteria bacterium HGW-Gammaproteobacteria-3]
MSIRNKRQRANTDLRPHWILTATAAAMLALYLYLCHYPPAQWRQHIPAVQLGMIRAIFYSLAIIAFPLTNLIRHIQLRLNQTMPGDKPAKSRYLFTLMISMLFAESIGFMGFALYWMGDDFNTLYIFSLLSALAIYLYRPKTQEYRTIVQALSETENGKP